MSRDRFERFERALGQLGASAERVRAGAATDHIAGAVEPPAVGVPIPEAGVTLPEGVDGEPTPSTLVDATTGVTPAAFGIAETGTIALPSTADGVEPVSLYPDRHVAVLSSDALLADLSAGLERLRERFADGSDSVVFATGRSSTADMGALVHGVHGPRDVHVIVVEGAGA